MKFSKITKEIIFQEINAYQKYLEGKGNETILKITKHSNPEKSHVKRKGQNKEKMKFSKITKEIIFQEINAYQKYLEGKGNETILKITKHSNPEKSHVKRKGKNKEKMKKTKITKNINFQEINAYQKYLEGNGNETILNIYKTLKSRKIMSKVKGNTKET